MDPDLKAKFKYLNKLVNSLTSCKPHYKVQLKDIISSLDKLQPFVDKIQEMTQDRSIRLKLSIKAVRDFEKEVSAGKQLCHDVSKEADLTKKPVYGIKLQRLSDSLRGVYAIFEERKKNRDRTETDAKQMLQKLNEKIQKLLKVKDHYSDVLTSIISKLASLQVLVKYVAAIEEHNRKLNLPIEVVQDFRNVLSLGIIHAEELSKERNDNKKTDKTPDLKHQLKVYNNSLGNQIENLTPPI